MPDNRKMFVPPPPPGFWRRRRLWIRRHLGVIALVAVIVVAAGLVTWHWWPGTCGGSESVWKADGECVGVTDGSYSFHDSLTDVEDKIAGENAAISGSGHTVTIALLDPLTVDETSAVSLDQIRNELEGAYTAQYRINHTGAVGDQRPLIKVVLANWGSHEQQWESVVKQLEEMVDDPDPLVAVVGLRLSIGRTEQAAKHLTRYDIPMVSAIATADQLNYGAIRGFVRASPANSEYVAALQAYLQDHPSLDSAIMVYDSNSDIPGADLFTQSLRDDFTRELTSLIKYPAQSYVGKSGQDKATPDLFTGITANICAVRPKVLLFAGRVVDFPGFLESLHNRVCPDAPVTVIAAGADFGGLGFRSQELELREKNVTIVYATETDATGWERGAEGTPPLFKDFYDQFRQLGFDPAHLDEGAVISTHDAMLIAAKAARLSTRAHPDHGVPSNSDVLNQMLNLNSLDTVPGASGQLSFSFRGADSGNPSNKPIPVIEVPSTSAARTAEVYHTR